MIITQNQESRDQL